MYYTTIYQTADYFVKKRDHHLFPKKMDEALQRPDAASGQVLQCFEGADTPGGFGAPKQRAPKMGKNRFWAHVSLRTFWIHFFMKALGSTFCDSFGSYFRLTWK